MGIIKNVIGMYQLAQDEKYMAWLYEFSKKHKVFGEDSFAKSRRIDSLDLFNVKCLSKFFRVIDFYSGRNEKNIGYQDKSTMTIWYVVKYRQKFFKFYLSIGQGAYSWVETSKTNCERFINFHDMMNFMNSNEFKVILEKDALMDNICDEMKRLRELGVDMTDMINLLTKMFVDVNKPV